MIEQQDFHLPSAWKKSNILQEVTFKTSLSGGKGGQHINKTSTKVELYWSPSESEFFNELYKELIVSKLSKQISNEGTIRIVCEESRSQLKNKEKAIEKFYEILASCFKYVAPRKATKVPKSVVKKRLDDKSKRKEIKQGRSKL